MDGQARIWVLADPRAGTAAQALGIAERLGRPFRTIPLQWAPLAKLPLPWPSLAGLTAEARRAFAPPWPALSISAGRRAAPLARWLHRRGARTVHCMRAWPATGLDLMVIGGHDSPPDAPGILPILGAAHRVSPARLVAARAEWSAFRTLPEPRVGLLLGGPIRGEGLDPAVAASLGERIAGFAGSVLATTSRRTGAAATEALGKSLAGVPHRLRRWSDTGPNPLLGIMAWANLLVVSGDSVSMISEALVTDVPLFIAPLGEEGARHRALHESLYAAGQARPLSAAPAPFPRVPLDETARIVAEIHARQLLA